MTFHPPTHIVPCGRRVARLQLLRSSTAIKFRFEKLLNELLLNQKLSNLIIVDESSKCQL